MASTSGQLGRHAIDVLLATEFPFAFLHGEDAAAKGQLMSDYDLAVAAPNAYSLVRRASGGWRSLGLVPVMLTEYDAGCATVWLATGDASDGLQIDLTFDARRVNRLDIPATEWVATAVPGVRWPRVAPEHERLYRERKAAMKRGSWSRKRSASRLVAEGTRLGRRLTLHRSGVWAHLYGHLAVHDATRVAERFSRFLPLVRQIDLNGTAQPRVAAQAPVVSVIYRAGLMVTHSVSPSMPRRADVMASARGDDSVFESLTEQMCRRLQRRLDAET